MKHPELLRIPEKKPDIAFKFGIAGYITVEKIRQGKVIEKYGPFKNIITNAALDALGTYTIGTLTTYMGIGSDNTAPATTDTQLGSQYVRTNSDGGFSDVSGVGPSNAYIYMQRTRLFTEPGSNRNVTEVGMFRLSSSGEMFMRQLILDVSLNPTTITQTTLDQLKITYEVRLYPYYPAGTQTITISGTSYTVSHQTINVSALTPRDTFSFASSATFWESNTMPSLTTYFSGNSQAVTPSWAAYTNGNYYRDLTASLTAAQGNWATGVGGFSYFITGYNVFAAASTFSPKFTKTNTKVLSLVVRIAWARH